MELVDSMGSPTERLREVGPRRSSNGSEGEARVHGALQRTHIQHPSMALVRGRAVVNFNNQNTVLLKLLIDGANGTNVVLLHDNRLFRFSLDEEQVVYRGHDPEATQPPKPSPDDLAQNILLRFQTSPKYRILNAFFLSFRLTDNLMLLAVIVLTVLNNGRITTPSPSQMSVFSAVGVELFYDVLLTTSKFWFLERLSPYIGLGLYVMYFSLCAVLQAQLFVWIVLIIRLAAFILEESVDIAIDIEMHNDLVLVCDQWPGEAEDLPYTDVRRSLHDFPYWPRPGFFVGSGSAWLPKSAFSDETYSRQPFQLAKFRWLYSIPILIFLPFALVVGLFVAIPLSIFMCIAWFCRASNLWAEMRHTY